MSLHDSTILITGATGFVGGALARRLTADGAHVRALVRSPQKDGYLRASPHFDRMTLVAGDITNPDDMKRVMTGCDLVFHVAAALGGTLEHLRTANVTGSRHVAEAAARAQVQRFVHVSSVAIYGYGVEGEVSEQTPPRQGHAPYGISKLEAERVVTQIAAHHDLSLAIVRPGAVYGPRSRFWTEKLTGLAKRRVLPFPAGSRGTIPAIYIDDLIDLLIRAAEHPAAHNKAFNATPTPSPDLRTYLEGCAGPDHPITWVPVPALPLRLIGRLAAATARPYTQIKDARHLVNLLLQPLTYRNDHAKDVLGWRPQVTLDQGLARGREYLAQQESVR